MTADDAGMLLVGVALFCGFVMLLAHGVAYCVPWTIQYCNRGWRGYVPVTQQNLVYENL